MRENELKIEEIEIDSLVPYENNAKKHTREQIEAVEASIKEFGFRNPVIVWRNADGMPEVVAGHARITAAKNLGMKKVPCVACDDLSDAQRRALTLVDNQTTMMTGWDEDLLAYELDVLADEFDMGDFGFSGELEPDGLSAVEEDDPEPEVTICRAKRGDVFVLGNHRVMCGDSTCPEDVEKLCGGGLADMILTDPPYNVALGQHMRPSEAKQLRRRTDGLVIDNDEFKDEAQFEPQGRDGARPVRRQRYLRDSGRADGPQVPVHGARPALLRRDHNEMGEHDGPRGGPRDGGSLIKRCESCGREFQAKRSTARFCCSTCRSHAYRGYAYVGELKAPAPNAAMSDDEVLEVIQRAHVAASDMSRASLMTAAPLCLSLKKAAKKMEDALRGEGL